MNNKIFSLFLMAFAFCTVVHAEEIQDTMKYEADSESRWVAPPPADENARLIKFLLQADYQQDGSTQGQAYSVLDLSAKRQLDESSVLAEGLIRVRKSLSISDTATSLDFRLARISYLEPWLQVTAGRFDLFQTLTPNLFFGAYPIMGIHRVDGVMATLPFSFLFKLGSPKQEAASHSSPPLAISVFYAPSLFSAQLVQYDLTQAFWLSQLRFRIETKDFQSTFRANIGGSQTNFFSYSSLNGDLSYSVSADLGYQQNYDLTAEYGVQNAKFPVETGVFSLGFQANRLGTWGAFSLDQIAVEAQFPLSHPLNNPFTGGNGLTPILARSSQNSWYAKIRTRLKVLFLEFHVTNNQDDFTFGRPTPGSIGVPFTGNFGPGNEADGPGTSLRSNSYESTAFLVRTGVEF